MRKNLTRTVDPLRDTAQQLLYIEIFCERRCVNMEKYAKAQMEVIEFENEDVITASGTCTIEGYRTFFRRIRPRHSTTSNSPEK